MNDTPAITVEYATENDQAWLERYDPHVERTVLAQKILRREVLVARSTGVVVGLLRYSLFWDTIPYIVYLFVQEHCRGRGIGSQLVCFFEQEMRSLHCDLVVTSSRAEGNSQHFWRKLGYHDVGSLALPHLPFELLFSKEL